ncbi:MULTISPECIES: hypothetical protein [unclassified Streptomyces]|uniref:hypothetical protein n=1 Tax=unclassified Streptomyces TaxID=2593676 RepID=UPI00332416C8
MIVVLLVGVLALVAGGCACVVWAERGGPRWARVVATVTLTASELLRDSAKKRRRGLNSGSQGDD